MIDHTATHPHPGIPPESPQIPSPEPAAPADRLDWLFRDALRQRKVHPLMELLRRYRGREAA
jgi:hypothetical protein